jgi:hypothetical protein
MEIKKRYIVGIILVVGIIGGIIALIIYETTKSSGGDKCTNKDDCNNHGTSTGTRPNCNCVCSGGWSGDGCETPPMGLICTDKDNCNNHGTAYGTVPGCKCVCTSGWSGDGCKTAPTGWTPDEINSIRDILKNTPSSAILYEGFSTIIEAILVILQTYPYTYIYNKNAIDLITLGKSVFTGVAQPYSDLMYTYIRNVIVSVPLAIDAVDCVYKNLIDPTISTYAEDSPSFFIKMWSSIENMNELISDIKFLGAVCP